MSQHSNSPSALAAGASSSNHGTSRQQQHAEKASLGKKTKIDYEIIDVWQNNFHNELEKIVQHVEDYPYIAMDTEFPGIVARPVGSFKTTSEKNYQTLRCNVNLLKIIQLGLTFCDKDGNVPENGRCIWQFNFKFDLQYDMFAQDSIQLLTDSGINFKRHATEGIDVQFFAEKIMCSGIVLSDDVKWISFHSAYDFGYLIKLLTSLDLPETESEFFRLLKLYFPHIYDVKYLMKNCETLRGGLNQLGQDLNVSRFGPAHQAGSDSLLTLHTFFAIVEQYFDSNLDEKHIGVLFGLNANGDTNGVMNYNSYTNSSTPLHFYSPSPSLSGTPKR